MSQQPPNAPPPPGGGSDWGGQPSQPRGGDWHQGRSWEGQEQPPGWGGAEAYDDPGGAPSRPRTGMAIAALVCGVVALLLSWIPLVNFIGILLGLLAVIFGIVAIRRTRSPAYGGRGMAIGGLVTGAVGLLLSVLILIPVLQVITDEEVQRAIQQGDQDALERRLEELADNPG